MKNKLQLAVVLAALLSVVFVGFAALQGGGSESKPPVSGMVTPNGALPAGLPKIALDVSQTAPRPVEDSPVKAIIRDSGRAWRDMAEALDKNRADLLPASFIGVAQQKLAAQITAQQRSGLTT